jgi:phage-related protein
MTQAVYYRDSDGREPVNGWLESLLTTKPAAVAKIDAFVDQYLNGHRPDDPPPEFPISSQIEGGLRELRVRFANTRYRLLYQRSGNLLVLLHGLEKNTGALPTADK